MFGLGRVSWKKKGKNWGFGGFGLREKGVDVGIGILDLGGLREERR